MTASLASESSFITNPYEGVQPLINGPSISIPVEKPSSTLKSPTACDVGRILNPATNCDDCFPKGRYRVEQASEMTHGGQPSSTGGLVQISGNSSLQPQNPDHRNLDGAVQELSHVENVRRRGGASDKLLGNIMGELQLMQRKDGEVGVTGGDGQPSNTTTISSTQVSASAQPFTQEGSSAFVDLKSLPSMTSSAVSNRCHCNLRGQVCSGECSLGASNIKHPIPRKLDARQALQKFNQGDVGTLNHKNELEDASQSLDEKFLSDVLRVQQVLQRLVEGPKASEDKSQQSIPTEDVQLPIQDHDIETFRLQVLKRSDPVETKEARLGKREEWLQERVRDAIEAGHLSDPGLPGVDLSAMKQDVATQQHLGDIQTLSSVAGSSVAQAEVCLKLRLLEPVTPENVQEFVTSAKEELGDRSTPQTELSKLALLVHWPQGSISRYFACKRSRYDLPFYPREKLSILRDFIKNAHDKDVPIYYHTTTTNRKASPESAAGTTESIVPDLAPSRFDAIIKHIKAGKGVAKDYLSLAKELKDAGITTLVLVGDIPHSHAFWMYVHACKKEELRLVVIQDLSAESHYVRQAIKTVQKESQADFISSWDWKDNDLWSQDRFEAFRD